MTSLERIASFFKRPFGLIVLMLFGLYFGTHLWGLTALPVFADESIYIRWSQLIIDDWQQYAFFPLNDGKTPLYMWLMVPFQFLFSDQLYAGRFVSVLVGALQAAAIGWLIKEIGGRRKAQLAGMMMVVVLPFWYFHHRMALIDGLLTLWLTTLVTGILVGLKSFQKKPVTEISIESLLPTFSNHQIWLATFMSALSVGLALWTKLPALLLLPALPFLAFWPQNQSWQQRIVSAVWISGSIGLGLVLFLILKLHPAFGQLFSRGGDFLYPFGEVLFQGGWQQTVISWPNYIWYFVSYLTWPVFFLNLTGLFLPKTQRSHFWLLWLTATFVGPIMLFGIVVYPRYLFPAALFATVSAALAWDELLDWLDARKNLSTRLGAGIILIVMTANSLGLSALFIVLSATNPDQLPFVAADRVQYLEEWSSGHGLTETIDLINQIRQTESVAVATEGYFGTLPDGLLLYFHGQNVDNLYLEGIGQPVGEIPTVFSDRAAEFDRQLLVVNSHRLLLDLPEEWLLLEICRPNEAPCLQVWDLTDYSSN